MNRESGLAMIVSSIFLVCANSRHHGLVLYLSQGLN